MAIFYCAGTVKNKGKFQTFRSKSGRGSLQEVPKKVIWLGNIFGIFENWSLRRGGCLRELVATGGSTVAFSSFKMGNMFSSDRPYPW